VNERADPIAIGALILVAIEGARSSVKEEVQERVKALLSDLVDQPSDLQIQSITRTLDLLRNHAPAREAVVRGLQSVSADSHSAHGALVRGLLMPLASETSHGVLYVCPEDPTHYRRRVADIQEDLRCPLHDVPLKPEE